MHVPTRLTVWNSTATCSARIALTNCADSNNSVLHVHCNMSQLSMEAGQPWASYLLSSGNYHGLRPSHSYCHTPASGIALRAWAVHTPSISWASISWAALCPWTHYHTGCPHSAQFMGDHFMGCTSCVDYPT